jgi:phenylacetate-CoA ligase
MQREGIYQFNAGEIPPVQKRDPAKRKASLDALVVNLVGEARRSPHYAKSFADLTIEGVTDLRKLPILRANDYVVNMVPYSNALLTTGSFLGGTVSKTGGTTDKPKYAVWGTHDKDEQIEASLPLLEALGLCKGDVVANMLHVGNLYSGLLSVEFETFRMGLVSLPLSVVSPEMLVQVWKDWRFNALVIQPSTALPVLRRALELEPRLAVEKVIFGGQSMILANQRWLKEHLGVKRLASVIASNDGGPFGYQCEHMTENLHHIMDEYNYVEIVDDDGHVVPDGEEGRILLTNLRKFTVPLVRYEIGDMGRLVTGMCTCGRTDRRIEFLGRSRDGFILGGSTTNIHEFKAALAPFDVTEVEVILDHVGAKDTVTVRFAAQTDVNPEAMLASLKKRYLNLHQIYQADFRFEQVASGSLPRHPVSGKVVELIDRRK